MRTPAQPTDADLAPLGLLLPSWIKLRVDPGRILVTLHSPNGRPTTPLVTYALRPEAQPDFAGEALARAVEHLGAAWRTQLREWGARGGAPDYGEILTAIINLSVDTTNATLADRALSLSTEEIHTTEGVDWV